MEERLEQLVQITQMCLNELKLTQTNCERYELNVTTVTNELISKVKNPNYFLTECDSFLTTVTNIMDAARKFNIHISLCSATQSETCDIFFKKKRKEAKEISNGYTEASNSHYFPAEEYDLTTEGFEDFDYPTLNLSEVYKPNEIVSGTVTHIKSLKGLSFFMFDFTTKYRSAVVELSKSLELRQYDGLPNANEVFGCVLDNQIFRAVLSSKIFYDEEMNERIIPCYLLDTGEILPLKTDHITYKLTNEQKQIPALAVPCQLVTKTKNPFKNDMESKLKDFEYKNCNFKIIAIENNTLIVDIVDDPGIKTADNRSEDMGIEIKKDHKQLTEEELEIMYEEPLSTSNAMKAVMGYDPKDDKRICRFYDASTGGCFKGVNCKLEHSSRQPDGWTKDILPASSIIDGQHPITIFSPGSIINITPTYIGQLDRFYAQINEPKINCNPLVWNEEDIPAWKLLQKPPHMFELVLSRYVDGLWYRAKIMSHDDEYKWFKVLYVDYGNMQMVHLRNLASIDNSVAALPFQAVLCRFESVKEKATLSTEERKSCMEIICEMILNKTMDAKVISHYEDLFISFVDKKTYPLPDVLIEMGFLDPSLNKILL